MKSKSVINKTSYMNRPTLKILYLEDVPADAELVVAKLMADGLDMEIDQAYSGTEFLSYLNKNHYDIILSDYNLPAYDGLEALKLVKKICPDVPFICISGTIGEERAVDLLKEGAADYVLKDRLERLPYAARRALNEVDEKRALKKAENELRKLSMAVEYSPVSITITDIDGVIEYANPRFYEMSGQEADHAVGNKTAILKSGLMHRSIYKNLWETILNGKVWRGELINRNSKGSLYWVNKSISSITDANGQIINFISVDEDITDKKKNEEELVSAKDRAEESDRLKSSFLANMSHEIRTPLNSIIGFSELLTDPEFDEEQKNDFVRVIIENGNNLLKIIDDILDISRLAAGKVRVFYSQVAVQQFIFSLQREFVFKAQAKGIDLVVSPDIPSEEIVLETDVDRLKQIFYNLISNAIKFTENGSIEIGFTANEKSVQFVVSDTGAGIPDDYKEKIFQQFIQVESSLTRKHGGNGLGLAITRNLVELLNGTIRVESEVGKGSSFFFELPYHSPENA